MRQARLDLRAAPPPALVLAEILRMLREPDVGRQERVERVRHSEALDAGKGHAAEFLRESGSRTCVHAHPTGIFRMPTKRPRRRRPQKESRTMRLVQTVRHLDAIPRRNDLRQGREPTAAAEALQDLPDGIQDAALAAREMQLAVLRPQPKTVLAQVSRSRLDPDDGLRRRTGDAEKIIRQLPGRFALLKRRLVRQDDGPRTEQVTTLRKYDRPSRKSQETPQKPQIGRAPQHATQIHQSSPFGSKAEITDATPLTQFCAIISYQR